MRREPVCRPWNPRVCLPTSPFQPLQLSSPCNYQQDSASNPREGRSPESGSTFSHRSRTNQQNDFRPASPLPRKEYQDTITARAPTAVPSTVIFASPLPVRSGRRHCSWDLRAHLRTLHTPTFATTETRNLHMHPAHRVSRMLLRRRGLRWGLRNFSSRSQRLDKQDHRKHYQWLAKRNRL